MPSCRSAWCGMDASSGDRRARSRGRGRAISTARRLDKQPSSVVVHGLWGAHRVRESLHRLVGVRNGPTIKRKLRTIRRLEANRFIDYVSRFLLHPFGSTKVASYRALCFHKALICSGDSDELRRVNQSGTPRTPAQARNLSKRGYGTPHVPYIVDCVCSRKALQVSAFMEQCFAGLFRPKRKKDRTKQNSR